MRIISRKGEHLMMFDKWVHVVRDFLGEKDIILFPVRSAADIQAYLS